MNSPAPSERTRVRRVPQRAAYDRPVIDAILDEALICHVGLVTGEQPFVLPTIHLRLGDELFIHGSAASRMLEHAGLGARLCITVTLVDGIVLARSAFHHSMNYRSVVILGQARLVTERAEKLAVFAALLERFAPGRSVRARAPNDRELNATHLLAIPIVEASAKLRTGGPIDDDADLSLPLWAGVVPVRLEAQTAEVALPIAPGEPVPALGFPLARPRSVERG